MKTTICCGLPSFDPWESLRSGKSTSFIFPFARLSNVSNTGTTRHHNAVIICELDICFPANKGKYLN
jgi:hypothetical protein